MMYREPERFILQGTIMMLFFWSGFSKHGGFWFQFDSGMVEWMKLPDYFNQETMMVKDALFLDG